MELKKEVCVVTEGIELYGSVWITAGGGDDSA